MTPDGELKIFASDLMAGMWGWRVCSDGTRTYTLFPYQAPDVDLQPDTATLESIARSVTITPQVPTIHTSPPTGALHLVNLETWFWIDPADWAPVEAGTNAGTVRVDVTATPAGLVIDPGDGSAPLQCPGGGTPYDSHLPADAQHSDCTHTYTEAGTYTATARVVFDVDWSSSIGPGGDLGDITPTGLPFAIQVAEGQAVVVTGSRNGSANARASGSDRSR